MNEMDVKKFVYLFMACNCYRDCFYLDLDYFNNYLYNVFNLEYDEIDRELKNIIDEMQKSNYVSVIPGFEYLIKVNSDFPYQEIVFSNKQFTNNMLMCVNDYNSYVFNDQKNGQIKVRK